MSKGKKFLPHMKTQMIDNPQVFTMEDKLTFFEEILFYSFLENSAVLYIE